MISFPLIMDSIFDHWTSFGVIANNITRQLLRKGIYPVYLKPWKESTKLYPELMELPLVYESLSNAPRGNRILRISGSDSSGHAFYNCLADTPPVASSWERLKHAPYILVPAEGSKKFLIERIGFRNDNVRVVHRGSIFPHFKRPIRDTYTFIYIGYFAKMKGVHLICEAFSKAFPTYIKDVRLILKGNNEKETGKVNIPKENTELLKPILNDPRVTIIRDNRSHFSLGPLLYQADCYIYPFHTMGYSGGKAALEARSSGCATVMPKFGDVEIWGTQKYLFTAYEKVIEKNADMYQQKVRPDFDYNWGGFSELRFELDEIIEKMKLAYEDRARGEPLKGWTWSDATDELIKVLLEK